MKQYCLKLDNWTADKLDDYIRRQNANLPFWKHLKRNRVINEAIEDYITRKSLK